MPWYERNNILIEADILINSTILGMEGQFPLDLKLDDLPRAALVTDIIYKPLMTPLLVKAEQRGNPIVDGLGMLLYQAAGGFEYWYGIAPEVTAELRKYVLDRTL